MHYKSIGGRSSAAAYLIVVLQYDEIYKYLFYVMPEVIKTNSTSSIISNQTPFDYMKIT